MRFRDNPIDAEKRFWTLFEELDSGPDRSVAIVGAAWIEEAIEDSLKGFLQDHKKSRDALFEHPGPLATFSAKIHLARVLGIITDPIYSDLHIIRDIRNKFAHRIANAADYTTLSFTTDFIRDKCFALECVKHERPTDSRVAFVRACVTLNTSFDLFSMMGDKAEVQHPVTIRPAAE